MTDLFTKLTSTPEGMKLYQQERASLEMTGLICRILEEEGITRKRLGKRIGKSKKYIDEFLDGMKKMDVRKISNILLALNHEVHFSASKMEKR